MGLVAEAAKSCFQGAVAAFVLGGFHGTSGGGSKILLPKVRVLSLRLVGFIVYETKAADIPETGYQLPSKIISN